MSKIIDNLYIGSLEDAKKNKPRCDIILNVCEDELDYAKNAEIIIEIPMKDNSKFKIEKYFDWTSDFIDNVINNLDKKLMVNCYAGISRSVSIVCCYLIDKFGISYEDAINIVREARPIADPNNGFVKKLKSRAKNQLSEKPFK